MLNYRATFTNAAALDLFQGGGSTGKWDVAIRVSTAPGTVRLSLDGSTLGALLPADGSGFVSEWVRFQVEDQDLYLIAGSAGSHIVDVIITPVLDTKITTC